jgi:hypothetical protein
VNIITLDSETYFDDAYTLKKMTTEEYIRDPRFECLGWGVRYKTKFDYSERLWLTHDEFIPWAATVDWQNTAVLCHHAHFDGLILSHHYGIHPKFFLDTLSMARMVHGNHVSASLGSLSKLYGLEPKSVPYDLFKGKHYNDLDSNTRRLLAEGCLHDVELTWDIFRGMAPGFPKEEFELINLTTLMFTMPVLQGDLDLLGKVWLDEQKRKKDLLSELALDKQDLQSSDKFAGLLRAEGIEPETKTSPKGNQIYAFAKTDEFMKELLENEDERVRGLAEARLGLKSSLNQARAERIGGSASRGSLPIYLSYCAAHTGRWGGGDSLNWQNLPRGGSLRKAILPPKGWKIAVADLSQIECRLLNFLAGQEDIIELFKNKGDPYVKLASKIYGFEVNKRDHPSERGTGKQGELSCGYGCGPPKFQQTARLGIYGPPIQLSINEAEHAVSVYRETHLAVTDYWKTAGRMISRIAGGHPIQWGPMEIRDKRIWLPNGACIIYDTLEYDNDAREWRYKTRKGWNKLYGAKLCQHVCEALGRLIIGQAALRLYKRGYRMVMTSHDEGSFLVREDEELNVILEEFKREPTWLPGCPVDAEGVVGQRYEK